MIAGAPFGARSLFWAKPLWLSPFFARLIDSERRMRRQCDDPDFATYRRLSKKGLLRLADSRGGPQIWLGTRYKRPVFPELIFFGERSYRAQVVSRFQ